MGRPLHFEIHASTPKALQAFYETVFGWRFSQWGDQEYWFIRTGDTELPPGEMDPSAGIDGGLQPREGDVPAEGQPVNAFVVIVEVDDAQATVDKALAAGGNVAIPLEQTPDVGIVAYLKDPDGNLFGILEPPGEQ